MVGDTDESATGPASSENPNQHSRKRNEAGNIATREVLGTALETDVRMYHLKGELAVKCDWTL